MYRSSAADGRPAQSKKVLFVCLHISHVSTPIVLLSRSNPRSHARSYPVGGTRQIRGPIVGAVFGSTHSSSSLAEHPYMQQGDMVAVYGFGFEGYNLKQGSVAVWLLTDLNC